MIHRRRLPHLVLCWLAALASGGAGSSAEPRESGKPLPIRGWSSKAEFEAMKEYPKEAEQDYPPFFTAYYQKVKTAIGSLWQQRMREALPTVQPGAVVTRLEISSTGVITVRSIEGKGGTNEAALKIVRDAIAHAACEKPSAEVAAWLKQERRTFLLIFHLREL